MRAASRANGKGEARPVPTPDDPLRGLLKLAAVAILGRRRILELAAELIVYVWQDIAIAGIVVVIAGGPGSGKTTLLFLVLAARLNRGEPVELLGRTVTPAPAGKYVVVIEAEHGDRSACRKLERSCRLLGIHDEALDRIVLVARRSVRIGSPEWADVERLVAAGLVSDIALDTLARVAPGDANDEREQVAIFESIATAIDRAPTADTKPIAWVVAHNRKSDTDELADVSGSSQRTGQADTVLLVKADRLDGRVSSTTVKFAKLREEPDEYPAPVRYTIDRGAIRYEDRRPSDNRPLEVRITEQLAIAPLTKSALSQALRTNKDLLDEALTNLFSVKQIETTTRTIRGRKYKAFALRTSGAPIDAVRDVARTNTPYEEE